MKQNKLERYIDNYQKELTEAHLDMLRARGLNDETIKRYRIGYDKQKKRYIIPAFLHGQPIYWVGWSPSQKLKYLFPSGLKKPLVGIKCHGQENFLVVEGMFDWLVLIQADFPAICILGNQPSKDQLAQLNKADNLVLMLDGDEQGRKAALNLAEKLSPKARVAMLPDGEDPNSLAVTLGDGFTDEIKRLVSEAKHLLDIHIDKLELLKDDEKNAYAEQFIFLLVARLGGLEKERYAKILAKALNVRIKTVREAINKAAPEQPAESKEIPKEVLEQGETFAHKLGPNPLEEVTAVIHRLGVIGEDDNVKTIYLVVTSRLLDKPNRPVSTALKGSSSAGKSYILDKVLDFFPKEAYIKRTSLSTMALVYLEEEFRHRTLVIFEAVGISDDGYYFLRSLLSEGRLSHQTVDRSGGSHKGRFIDKEGPTNCILTTTKDSLDPETETRLLSLPINESREQTKAIILQSARPPEQQDLSGWRAFQTWLSVQPAEVDIPYGENLAELIKPVTIRLRRDSVTLRSMIQAHALLCQAHRKRNKQGQIIATLKDYEIVRKLVAPIISQGAETAVKPKIRETVEAVRGLIEVGEATTLSIIGKMLGIGKHSASKRVKAARKAGYLINNEIRPGHPLKLVLGEPLPEDIDLLPPCDILFNGGSGENATVQHPDPTAGGTYQEPLQPPLQHLDNDDNDPE